MLLLISELDGTEIRLLQLLPLDSAYLNGRHLLLERLCPAGNLLEFRHPDLVVQEQLPELLVVVDCIVVLGSH